MPVRHLPEDPSLENLRKHAKQLRAGLRAHDPQALELLREFHPRADVSADDCKLSDAQLIVARQYGFASWPKLKAHLDGVDVHAWSFDSASLSNPHDAFLVHACLTYSSHDHPSLREKARAMLADHPQLGQATIYTAAAAGEVGAVRQFLAHDPSLARRRGGPQKWEPHMYAIYSRIELPNHGRSAHQSREIVRLLLDAGADPNAGCLWRGNLPPFTALTGAFGDGEAGLANQPPHPDCQAVARLLLERGADPNDEQTLYNRHFRPADDHLRILLEYGLGDDRNGPWYGRFGDRMTPPADLPRRALEWAVRANQVSHVRVLLEHGVDIHAIGPDGRTVHDLARLRGCTGIAALLEAHGAAAGALEPRDALLAACMSGDVGAVDELVQRHGSALVQGLHAEHPDLVIRAVESGEPSAVALVIGLGFDVNYRSRVTPLHAAAWRGDVGMAALLLDRGANPALRDTEFDATPLGWAEHSGQAEMVRFLKGLADA